MLNFKTFRFRATLLKLFNWKEEASSSTPTTRVGFLPSQACDEQTDGIGNNELGFIRTKSHFDFNVNNLKTNFKNDILIKKRLNLCMVQEIQNNGLVYKWRVFKYGGSF